jgi:hypothetical protein
MLAYGVSVTSFMVYLEPFWEWVWDYDIDLNKLIYKKNGEHFGKYLIWTCTIHLMSTILIGLKMIFNIETLLKFNFESSSHTYAINFIPVNRITSQPNFTVNELCVRK